MKAVILAAGTGTRLEPLTRTLPKCMVPVAGVPLIDRMIARMDEAGIEEVIVVAGHLYQVLEAHLAASSMELARRARVVFNERYADWGNFYSLLVARDTIGASDFIKCDGDVVLDPALLPRLMRAQGAAVLALDRRDDLGDEEMKVRLDAQGRVVELNKRMDPALAVGESLGVERIGAALGPDLFAALEALIGTGETHEYYERAYERLIDRGVRFTCVDIDSTMWCEIDDLHDLEHAHEVIARQERARAS
jgi:choline kinase